MLCRMAQDARRTYSCQLFLSYERLIDETKKEDIY